ncbi:MAG: carotenoid biosynthesis protein [Bacteroidota bacterium]
MKFSKLHIATAIAILFHISGLIGILFTPYKDWFIQNTPLNLCLMGALLIWTHEGKNVSFFLFFITVFFVGIGVEMIGVNTGRLFGDYHYGNVLGAKLNGVPWLIGLNWFIMIFCSAAVMQQVHAWFKKKMEDAETQMSPRIAALSLVIDGAFLATFFDCLMEPVAMKLGFWQWNNGEVPIFNYTCWFGISLVLLLILRWFRFPKANHFAVHLFIIQLLFFLTLRTYLV